MATAELKVDVAGSPVTLALAEDAENVETAGSLPVVDFDARTQLAAIVAALGGTLTVDTNVSALATEAKLEAVRALLAGTLAVNTGLTTQTDALTDTQLRASDVAVTLAGEQVSVANFPATQAVSGTVAVSNHPTPQTDALTDTQLRASAVDVNDDYTGGETLADQSPAAAVVTFTFSSAVRMVVVQPDATGMRADPFGGTPAAATGIPLVDDAPNFLPVQTSSVKVYGTGTVSVWGFR